MPRKRVPLNDGHTLHLADEYHPDPRVAARAIDAKAQQAQQQRQQAQQRQQQSA